MPAMVFPLRSLEAQQLSSSSKRSETAGNNGHRFYRSHDPVAVPRIRLRGFDPGVQRYLDGCICFVRF